jgi:hypothetical protein
MPVGLFFNNSSNYRLIQISWGSRTKGQNPKPGENPKLDSVKWPVGKMEGWWRANVQAEGKNLRGLCTPIALVRLLKNHGS